jgi:DNA-binding XRE family transcriptional regulator
MNPEAAQQTLTRAALRAAELLDVPQAELGHILGVSPATVSRMAAGRYVLQPDRKEWQLAALFIRLFRSLDSITGGEKTFRVLGSTATIVRSAARRRTS